MHTYLRLGSGLLFLACSAFAAAPVIQRSDAVGLELGQSLDYHVVAVGGVTGFTAQGLPAGVAIDAATGAISGTPAEIGIYKATISAANADGASTTTLTVSVVSPTAAPLIYAPLFFDAYQTPQQGGNTFSCQLRATGSPTSFGTNEVLPTAWTFSNGTFVGRTAEPGVHVIPVNATNGYGVGSAAITIRVHPACTALQQTMGTLNAGDLFVVTVQFNRPVSFTGTAPYLELHASDGSTRKVGYLSGNGTSSFQFGYRVSATDPAGNIQLYTTIQPAEAGAVTSLADQDGLTLGAALPISGPVMASASIAAAAVPAPVTPVAANTTTPAPTSATPTASSAAPAPASSTSTPSTPAAVTQTASAPTPTGGAASALPPAPTAAAAPRLVNLSARGEVRDGDSSHSFIAGFVVSGSAPKQMLLRAVGPSLAGFGVSDAIGNPTLRVYDAAGHTVAQNDDWSGGDVAAAAHATGAFALHDGSRDAALLVTLPPGTYSMQVVPNGGVGVALAEIYDTNTTAATAPLLNISTRGHVGASEGLTAGFVVAGSSPKRVLVRGVGPALAGYGVAGVLSDPTVTLYHDGQVVAVNDNWQTTQGSGASGGDVATAASASGAFPLADGSRDAALLVTLAPGTYSAVFSPANGAPGAGLVEVYEVP